MRFLIACGGTGGHFYPGYVLGQTLRARGHEVLFVLRRHDPSEEVLDANDFPYTELNLRGMPRGLTLRWFTFPWDLLRSCLLSRNIIRSYGPDAVVGMGGYLTFPIAIAARLRGIPYVLHESNSLLGLANRVCAGGAHCVALGLPLVTPPPHERTVLTGTPIRKALKEKVDSAHWKKQFGLNAGGRTLLVLGGSQGAQAFNRIVPAALKLYAQNHDGTIQVLHISGHPQRDIVIKAYEEGPALKWAVTPYLPRMELAYAIADLVLSRAGAGALSELVALHKPAILIPYPHAAAGHQEKNARLLERSGAARIILESDLTPEVLCEALAEVFDSDGALGAMAEAYSKVDIPCADKAADALADIVVDAAK